RGIRSDNRIGRRRRRDRTGEHRNVYGKGAGRPSRARLCAAEKRRSAGPRAKRASSIILAAIV
ncbi:MAG: hypothetical protein KF786_16325, partial [Burkholderiaceae bacterium]|nr:hypothetical protein [Burkholderiaceae bacterium]